MRHDPEVLASDYAEDAVLHSPTAGIVSGRSAIERVYRVWMSAFPDLKVNIEELIIAGDRVTQVLTVSGTDAGFLGFTLRPYFDVASTSVPCRAIGGDFFDYVESPDGTFDFVLADVAGKGPPAALLTAVLCSCITADSSAAARVRTAGGLAPGDIRLHSL